MLGTADRNKQPDTDAKSRGSAPAIIIISVAIRLGGDKHAVCATDHGITMGYNDPQIVAVNVATITPTKPSKSPQDRRQHPSCTIALCRLPDASMTGIVRSGAGRL